MRVDVSAPTPGLYWGIKQSFLRYVAQLADGGYLAQDGATLVDDDTFRFAPEPDQCWPPADDVIRFQGTVVMQGHGRLLRVQISDPWLHNRRSGCVLSIRDPDSPTQEARLNLAVVGSPDHGFTSNGPNWNSVATRLDSDGVSLFAGQYDAGEELSSLTVVW